ncbi:MAG TPA: EAL domain-containing protein [Terriglobales bacterium]|nr:EAL domain-containing protein [Terriglobales bacterium]
MTFNLPIAQLETLARTSCAHALWAVFSVADFERYSGWLVLGLIVLLTYQQWRLHQFRRQTAEREKLFRIVAENAADMIALVDAKGKRLYNSPAYEKVLGYSQEELAKTAIFEQIHPEDRLKVLEAGREARSTGVGKKLQYRMRHKDGTWKVLESSATTIMNAQGDVEQLVIVNRDITDRTLAEEKVEQSSFRDSLTQLPNRHLFIDRLQHAFARAERNLQYQYAILLVDVDHFKEFNQNIGTSQGDKVILELARRLASSIRHDDTVARPQGEQPIPDAVLSRMGGDEFTILLEGIKDASDALRVAERIQKAIGQPFTVEGRELIVSASIGIALSSTGHARAEDLLHDADIAMRRAKTLGGSRSEVFDEAMHARAVGRLKLEAELRNAIESDQFCLFYQPVVHLDSETITGFEALLRWHHPKQGLISPQKFFDVAENVGLIVVIGRWALRQGCAQIRALSSRGSARDRLNITVNISAKQLAYPNLVSDVRGAVQDTRIEPSQLLLEITETDAMADPKKTLEVFSQLKAIGVGISIADFGTGHSSLSWLRRLPIDELKIDRSLIASMSTDRCSADIVQLILNVGCELNLRVVAQGIESAIHLAWLKKLHCEFGQGFYFSEPLDAAKAEKLLNGFHFPIAASTTAR